MNDPEIATHVAEHGNQAWQVMSWYGFGSPVGLGILILSVSASALLLRMAILGLK